MNTNKPTKDTFRCANKECKKVITIRMDVIGWPDDDIPPDHIHNVMYSNSNSYSYFCDNCGHFTLNHPLKYVPK